jgi:hypothetical protein
MKVPEWHSQRVGETVFHNNDECEEGRKVLSYYVKAGQGNRPLCRLCMRIEMDRPGTGHR